MRQKEKQNLQIDKKNDRIVVNRQYNNQIHTTEHSKSIIFPLSSFHMELNTLLPDFSQLSDSYHYDYGTGDIVSLDNQTLDEFSFRSPSLVANSRSYLSIALPELTQDHFELTKSSQITIPCANTSTSISEQVLPSLSVPESSLSDEDMPGIPISPKSRRSVKHSISEKKRVIRFNTCVESFTDMLNSNGVSVRKNKLCVLVEVVRFIEKLQAEVLALRKEEKERKQQQENQNKLRIIVPQPTTEQQDYYTYLHQTGVNVAIITYTGTIVDANTFFCQSVGQECSSIIGSSFFSYAHASTLPSLYSSFSACLSGQVSYSQFIQLFSYRGAYSPHCFSIFQSGENFVISMVPLNAESYSTTTDRRYAFSVAGKTYCLLDQTHFPTISSNACGDASCSKGRLYNLESPKSPCVELDDVLN